MSTAAALDVRELTFGDAIKEAIAEEMRRDPKVVLMGEDVAEAGTTFKPGTWLGQACSDCECCAADRRVAPIVARTTIGTFHLPPDM